MPSQADGHTQIRPHEPFLSSRRSDYDPPVGWDQGADRASNDADVSLIPSVRRVFPSTAERPAFGRCLPDPSVSLSLLPTYADVRSVCLRPSCIATCLDSPARCRVAHSPMHRHGGWVVLRPRGPRSGSGYAVPIRLHLIDPMRPTRRHIAISSLGGLYAMPSLCGSA